MFYNAAAFNQDLGAWDIGNIQHFSTFNADQAMMASIFNGCSVFTDQNYSATLAGWVNNNPNDNVVLGANLCKATTPAGQNAYLDLTTIYHWTNLRRRPSAMRV